jgi:hypothetical protein
VFYRIIIRIPREGWIRRAPALVRMDVCRCRAPKKYTNLNTLQRKGDLQLLVIVYSHFIRGGLLVAHRNQHILAKAFPLRAGPQQELIDPMRIDLEIQVTRFNVLAEVAEVSHDNVERPYVGCGVNGNIGLFR